jgi:hypothetical protein
VEVIKNMEFNRSTEPEFRTQYDGLAMTMWIQEFKPFLFFWRVPLPVDDNRKRRVDRPDRMEALMSDAKRRWLRDKEYALKFKAFEGKKLSEVEVPENQKTWSVEMPIADQVTWTLKTPQKSDYAFLSSEPIKATSMKLTKQPDIAYGDHWDPGVKQNVVNVINTSDD